MTAPIRLRRYVSGAEAALGALAAECALNELDEDRAFALALMDSVSERFRGVNTRISQTRRLRVPLPIVGQSGIRS